MEVHVLRTVKQSEEEKLSLAEMKKLMPPCPICGKKAFIAHDIVDGFDFGYSAGCPSFLIDDGVHGITESFDPEAPRSEGYTANEAFDNWLAYCQRKEKEIEKDL